MGKSIQATGRGSLTRHCLATRSSVRGKSLPSRRGLGVALALLCVGCGTSGNTDGVFIGWTPDGLSSRFNDDGRQTKPGDGGPVTTHADTSGAEQTSDGQVSDVEPANAMDTDSGGELADGAAAPSGDVGAQADTANGVSDGTSQDSTSQDGANQDGANQDGANQDSTSQDSTSQDSTSQDSTSQDSGGQSGTADVVTVPTPADKDGDGFTVAGGDCDDNDKTVNPKATEICNGKDTDCTGIPDDLDKDGDGFSVCTNDCDDTDINVNPQAGRDCTNGKDNDCSGIIDAVEDGDKDGYAGCKDCNDYDKDVNPGAFELPVDMIDNDCDGKTDELPQACDTGVLNTNTMSDYAKAIDLCTAAGTTVLSSTFVKQGAANSRAIKTSYGVNLKPQEGLHMVVMSSGVAAAKGQPGYKKPQGGTSFSNSAPYPNVKCKNSGTVYDYTEWRLQLKVPKNVKAFAFDFNFMSSEFPEWVGSKFNDKFLAILDSKKFKGNISFDSKGGCISINNAFFTVCNKCKGGDAGLLGTGYEGGVGGGTGWLTTTSPVTPGETITLRFIVFDEGDHILDSAVVLDNFRWQTTAASGGGPSTVRPGG